MLTPKDILFAAFDIVLAIIILLRINWLPDVVNYGIAMILIFFAVYELAT